MVRTNVRRQPMLHFNSRVVTRGAYTAQYADAVAFRAGDEVAVDHPDSEFPEWFWCRGPDAREGWVHSSFLSHTSGRASGLRDYSAKELTVAAGESGRLIELLGGWAYVELDDGRCGWLPAQVIDAAV